MDRNLVYPGAIPLDTDILTLNRNAMVAFGFLAQACLGTNTVVDGLACTPTSPASLAVQVGPGSISQLSVVDASAYGSLPADTTDALVKVGINLTATSFSLAAPTSAGQSIAYMIEATLSEVDADPLVLSYYNASNPAQPFSGANNNGLAQNTLRRQVVQLQLKAGAPATTGSQALPPVDNGWVGLYSITVGYGQLAILSSNIAVLAQAPFIDFKLAQLRPGFGSGVQTFGQSGTFAVPNGVTQVEVEVWGGGSGSFASVSGIPSGGGGGGGYGRKRVTGLTAGTQIGVTVGAGGAGGTSGSNPTPGGSSSFGSFVTATGGGLNPLASLASPQNGAPGGGGSGGDFNAGGSSGQAGISNVGGLGGAAPMGGAQNSGTSGNQGVFPGGGASGAGTGSAGNQAYPGGPGAAGFVIVRW